MEEEVKDDGFIKIIPENEKSKHKTTKKEWSPAGIGTGTRYAHAKLAKCEFIDDYTYIEAKGRNLEAEKAEKALKLMKLEEAIKELKDNKQYGTH